MKLWNYIVVLISSFLLTAAMFVKACDCTTNLGALLCDFIAMIGGGVFCSTLVSWLIEKQNRAKEARNRDEQRKFVFASARNSFIRLFERELVEISTYYAEYLSKSEVKWKKEEITLPQIGEKLVWLLNQIEAAENAEKEAEVLIISVESMKQDEEKKRHLVTSNKVYYKSLHQILTELSTFYNTYFIAGLITGWQVELLRDLTWEINDILVFEPDIGIDDGTILVFKRMLFEKVKEYILALDISPNEEVHVHYRNAFHKK